MTSMIQSAAATRSEPVQPSQDKGWKCVRTAHLVHVENQIQLTDVFKAFVQRFHKHLQQIGTVKNLIPNPAVLLDLGYC